MNESASLSSLSPSEKIASGVENLLLFDNSADLQNSCKKMMRPWHLETKRDARLKIILADEKLELGLMSWSICSLPSALKRYKQYSYPM